MHFDFSLTFLIPSLNMGALVQREHPRNSGGIEGGGSFLSGKPAIYLKRGIYDQGTNRKSHTRFRFVPKSVTLDDLERQIRTLTEKDAFFGAHQKKIE